MKLVGLGQINLWEGGSLWLGFTQAPVEPHDHHAIQVTLGLDAPVRFRAASDPAWSAYGGAMVPPHLSHEFDGTGGVSATIFCEPESEVGRRLLARFGSEAIAGLPQDECAALALRLREAHAADLPDAELNAATQNALRSLADAAPRGERTDARILRAIAEIVRRIDQPVTLTDIADTVHMSSSRLRHLFVAETGIPFRPYVLWLRMQHALEHALGGASWTEAAHAAAFSDSAHLSRTFRRMFGMSPTALDPTQSAVSRARLHGA